MPKVPQGFVGLAFDRGQPILLAPGLHQWNSGGNHLSNTSYDDDDDDDDDYYYHYYY